VTAIHVSMAIVATLPSETTPSAAIELSNVRVGDRTSASSGSPRAAETATATDTTAT